MLNDEGVEFRYREYTQEPLTATEVKKVLKMLGVSPKDVLRKNDKAFKELGLTGEETNAALVKHMAQHPTLLQRPIGIVGDKAVVGRPPERLLELV